jgi:hypothetical protein
MKEKHHDTEIEIRQSFMHKKHWYKRKLTSVLLDFNMKM